jgi:hypothetical protein
MRGSDVRWTMISILKFVYVRYMETKLYTINKIMRAWHPFDVGFKIT